MLESFKSPASRLARVFKKSRDEWKAKALDKQRRLRASQVKIRDLEQSREQWKTRALEAEKALKEAQGQADKDLEAKAGEGVEKCMPVDAPGGHHYGLAEIQLAILMYLEAGVSGRGISHVFDVPGRFLRLRVPSYTTVLNWIYRCGVHVLNGPVPRRRDWIFVIDHTLGVGQMPGGAGHCDRGLSPHGL
jgi:hypothetical protein